MTSDELIDLVTSEIKDLSAKLESADYDNAVAEAQRETGWTLPTTVDFQIVWLKRRVKRHLIDSLLLESATKTKFEQINMQQKFDHFERLIAREDKAYKKIQEEEPYQFASVAPCQMFGTKIDAGFAYDRVGKDKTYSNENLVNITPSDSDE